MFGPLLLVVLLIPILAILLVVVLVRGLAATAGPGQEARPGDRDDPATTRARRHSAAATALTSALGLLAMIGWAGTAGPGEDALRLSTLPALGAAVVVLASAVAELTWPRPRGEVRVADLRARLGSTPAGLRRLLLTGTGAAAAALAVGAVTAAPDGHSVQRSVADVSATAGPYPGVDYAAPVGVAVLLLGLATWWALRRVDARPALADADVELDRAVRAASQVRVLRAGAAGLLLTSAGLWLTLGAAVNRVTQNLRMASEAAPHSPGDWVQIGGFLGLAVGLALLLAGLGCMVWPAPSIRRATAPDPIRSRA